MADALELGPTFPDAKEWEGLKLAARVRLSTACAHLYGTGQLNRADIMRIGEVSSAAAAKDLRTIRERVPTLMVYDATQKCYRPRGVFRIRLRRTKGWRMPPNTVKVTRGRGMKWGNPFIVGHQYPWVDEDGKVIKQARHTTPLTAELAVRMFRDHAERWFSKAELAELRGKNLACWCAIGAPCHADVLLELANG